jgi:hypothetical protein
MALSKKKKKQRDKVDEALKIAEFWLPYLNQFALDANHKAYEHPWIPVEVVREIARILKDE